jgi:hypothetical protein
MPSTMTDADKPRLDSQQVAVRALMDDGEWRTYAAIGVWLAAKGIKATEASISARVRALRDPKFGGYEVERKQMRPGLFAYRAIPPAPPKSEAKVQKEMF